MQQIQDRVSIAMIYLQDILHNFFCQLLTKYMINCFFSLVLGLCGAMVLLFAIVGDKWFTHCPDSDDLNDNPNQGSNKNLRLLQYPYEITKLFILDPTIHICI